MEERKDRTMTQTTMTKTCAWPGKSGRSYTYYVHDLTFDPSPDQDGNYIWAKVVNGSWQPVYIGQGDLKDRRNAHLKDGCVTRKGATHFHCHLNGRKQDRLAEEDDLLANFPQTFTPTGCNVNPSG